MRAMTMQQFNQLTGPEQRKLLLANGEMIAQRNSHFSDLYKTLWELGTIFVEMLNSDTTILELKAMNSDKLASKGWTGKHAA